MHHAQIPLDALHRQPQFFPQDGDEAEHPHPQP